MKMAFKIIGGIFLGLIAFIQLARFYLDYPISFGGPPLPNWTALAGFLVTGAISLWLFITAKK